MAQYFPYEDNPPLDSGFTGRPIRFNVGPEPCEFDIYHDCLIAVSPLFTDADGIPHEIPFAIELPSTDSDSFYDVCRWLYYGTPREITTATTASDLLNPMQVWVALGKLGIWDKQNTIMRLGMALMQPKDFICEIDTVKWVYENTEPGSKLRGYIIAIFCQRSLTPTTGMFSTEIASLGIHRDASAFMRIFATVRRANPCVKHDQDIDRPFPTYIDRTAEGGELEWLSVPDQEIEYPLPSFLVWGDECQDLPDEHFFVGPESVVEQGGRQVSRQIGAGGIGMTEI